MWCLGFVALLAFIWLWVSWGRLPSSSILVGYMRIHPMCFQSWFYRRGVQFRVAFFSIYSFRWHLLLLFLESRRVRHSLAGFFFFFRAFVLLLVASVVDKPLFACGFVFVTTWSSELLGVCCMFSSKTGASIAVCDFCGILATFVHGFSLSSLLAVGLMCLFRARSVFRTYFSMPPPIRSTNNNLSAGLSPEDVPPSSSASNAPASALSSSGTPLVADSIADAVVCTLGSSLPTIMASSQGNAPSSAASAEPPSSSASSGGTSAVGVGSGSSAPSSGTFTLAAFVPTFYTCVSHLRLELGPPRPITLTSSPPSSLGSLPCSESSSLWQKTDKAFIVGPGHAPIPGKLVAKIREGQFVELAHLLSINLREVEQEPQTFLEGKLLVSKSKRRQVEITDILTWTKAFTIFQMVTCEAHPQQWSDLTKYKLLIIQTAHQFSGRAWLEYDLAFRKDAAASGLSGWSKMNLDLYSFHLRLPATSSPQQLLSSWPGSSQSPVDSRDISVRNPFCCSWNEGICRWALGRFRFCSNCDEEHAKVNCPFPHSAGHHSRSPSPGRGGRRFLRARRPL